MSLLVLSAADVAAVLTRPVVIESQRTAYRAAVTDAGRLATGVTASDPESDALVFTLTGMVKDATGVVCKFGLQVPQNAARGLPSIHALVMLLDAETGAPLACLNGASLTLLRTSAGLAVAADVLSPGSARTLGVLGSGAQAAETIRMISEVRPLESVTVWSPTRANRELLAASLREELGVPVSAVDGARDAVADHDIVATCTLSREPVVHGEWLQPGQTVLTMGSYQPDRREIDLAASSRGTTFVDLLSRCRAVCGPLIEALDAGVLTEADVGEIGAVLEGDRPGRRGPEEIVIFHSMGIGYQDAAAGWAAYQGALERGLGTRVDL